MLVILGHLQTYRITGTTYRKTSANKKYNNSVTFQSISFAIENFIYNSSHFP